MAAIDVPWRRTAFVDQLGQLPVSTTAGVWVSEPDYALCTIQARRNAGTALAKVTREVFGVDLVPGPKAALNGPSGLIGVGPATWLAFQEGAAAGWPRSVAERMAGVASVNDQTGGYAVLRLSGPRVRDLLSKGAFLDFHPRAFAPRSAAVTLIAQMGVTLWLRDDGQTFEVILFRSYAESLWRWLEHAAAEYGLARRDNPASGRPA